MTTYPSFSFLLRLLFSKLGPLKLRQLIYGRKTVYVDCTRPHDEYSVLLVHPLLLLHWGLFPGQIGRVSLQVAIDCSQGKECSSTQSIRFLRIRPSYSLLPSQCLLSVSDLFNISSSLPIKTISIKNIVPYSRVSDSCPLHVADTLRVARVITSRSPPKDLQHSLGQFFSRSRIVYNGDIVRVTVEDRLEGQKEIVSFKIECLCDGVCIVDNRVSLYELSPCHSLVPLSSLLLPLQPLPPSLQSLVYSISSLSHAHSNLSSSSPLSLLLHGPSGSGKRLVSIRVAASIHYNWIHVNSLDIWSDISSQGESKLKSTISKCKSCHPCVLYISNIDSLGYDMHSRTIDTRVLSSLRSILSDMVSQKENKIIFILGCTTKQLSLLSPSLRSLPLYEFTIPSLNEDDRYSLFRSFFPVSSSIVTSIAKNTAGLVISEVMDVVYDSRFIAHQHTRDKVTAIDVQEATEKRTASLANAVGTAKIPSVSWNDIGGLEDSKKTLRESIETCLKGGKRVKRSGIILFGPPGCGKTLMAKAVATEYKIAFLSVKGPELLNKYVGQSEENLRNVFERARLASPCVIFFDELDSIAPNRGRHGDSGGVMDRIVSQLLSELDDLQSQKNSQVFVMAATNRADLLDPALLSPGRFDKVVNVSPGMDIESKTKVLMAVSRSVELNEDVEMEDIAARCPGVMSGAELYSIVSNATMNAIREQVSMIESGCVNEKEADLAVCHRHLVEAVEKGRHVVYNELTT